ncbi:hypothetical protein DUNSADRAFT_15044 [Dunaliella salina]|uniref:Encoded protein n=1 Tax=Dunaliella salina TaxID=3046 RepID=A0ABQ7G673_DUNSA|nr:hypothetical protein DUNSADRAFT_15044 [Dunaliella salina]|eukprot:KAF5830083.1 hypothetical protein DUNSADRAFT_15044 [Dunaliella salina]
MPVKFGREIWVLGGVLGSYTTFHVPKIPVYGVYTGTYRYINATNIGICHPYCVRSCVEIGKVMSLLGWPRSCVVRLVLGWARSYVWAGKVMHCARSCVGMGKVMCFGAAKVMFDASCIVEGKVICWGRQGHVLYWAICLPSKGILHQLRNGARRIERCMSRFCNRHTQHEGAHLDCLLGLGQRSVTDSLTPMNMVGAADPKKRDGQRSRHGTEGSGTAMHGGDAAVEGAKHTRVRHCPCTTEAFQSLTEVLQAS